MTFRGVMFCAGVAAFAGISHGAVISTGLYQLGNHPDGNATPPPYGLRLDELYDATDDHDIFSFDFEAAGSDVKLAYDGTTISISGKAWGGRDVGGSHAIDAYLGFYEFEFTYTVGVTPAPGDDDVLVDAANHANTGWISTPLGHTKLLDDERGGNDYSFRFGDEDDDLGHRGFPGISGWGWLRVDDDHTDAQDWLFTATLIPSPGAAGILAVGGLASIRRRRR